MRCSSVIVLDTSAFLHGYCKIYGDDMTFFIPTEVAEELKKFGIDASLFPGLSTADAHEKNVNYVKRKLKETGDIMKLSSSDIKIIALAYELGGKVVTDDYSIQNACTHLNIEFEGVKMEGIKKRIEWMFRCTGCHRVYSDFVEECGICGHNLKLWKWKV